jgi:hypothetical protein
MPSHLQVLAALDVLWREDKLVRSSYESYSVGNAVGSGSPQHVEEVLPVLNGG